MDGIKLRLKLEVDGTNMIKLSHITSDMLRDETKRLKLSNETKQ